MTTRFPHDGSETDDRMLADWLEDAGRYDEAAELRDALESGPDEPDWCYEPYSGVGGVGGVGVGVGGGVGGVGGGGGGVGVGVGGVGVGVGGVGGVD